MIVVFLCLTHFSWCNHLWSISCCCKWHYFPFYHLHSTAWHFLHPLIYRSAFPLLPVGLHLIVLQNAGVSVSFQIMLFLPDINLERDSRIPLLLFLEASILRLLRNFHVHLHSNSLVSIPTNSIGRFPSPPPPVFLDCRLCDWVLFGLVWGDTLIVSLILISSQTLAIKIILSNMINSKYSKIIL